MLGTDDDLSSSDQNRVVRSSSVTGNEKSSVGSVTHFNLHFDMEAQIHQLEQEAYSAVLRAFKAQSDALTWVYTIGSFHVFIVIFVFCCVKYSSPVFYFMYLSGEGRFDN